MQVNSTHIAPLGPPPRIDPELDQVLPMINEAVPLVGLLPDMIGVLRAAFAQKPTDTELELDGQYAVQEHVVGSLPGRAPVSLLICLPGKFAQPSPALYCMHGGGMIAGHNRSNIMDMLGLAREIQAAVISVEYRLAPEHPHPAPVEDCYSGLCWLRENAASLGIDPARIVVAGSSAGAGLAAALSLMSRDRGGAAIAGQMLMSPMLDDRNDTTSAIQMQGVGVWDRVCNQTGWEALLGSARGTDDVSPYAAPARATDVFGLPPAFVDAGEAETFRDEAVSYASRIWQAGGSVELHVWPGGFHLFDTMVPYAALSKDAKAARLSWLRRLLRSG
ncbi:alpha/beta hydrolase [Pseudofrankia sp. DC12]|uniref:alpha/beta hydrolase n=1 Tax=Pseudofrankia sp. DC12 TaxID=683315 RepID=UPI0005F7DE51|nr:alpha/beta hydrolase [Pseudofrankia sp. DC12]